MSARGHWRSGDLMEVETESVEIRKSLVDRARNYAKKYPVLYDSVEEFIEAGVRHEVIQIAIMDGKGVDEI